MALDVSSQVADGIAQVFLAGELDAGTAGQFKSAIEEAAAQKPKQLMLDMEALTFMASAGLRVLVFAKQKMGADVEICIVGAHDAVWETITMTGFHHSVTLLNANKTAAAAD
ncbi:MAG: STAS domain-containing protein [Caldilineaceae bacterium]